MIKNSNGTHPAPMITPNPPLVMAAPATPLTRACEELVGSASSQVVIFHAIAPTSPPATT